MTTHEQNKKTAREIANKCILVSWEKDILTTYITAALDEAAKGGAIGSGLEQYVCHCFAHGPRECACGAWNRAFAKSSPVCERCGELDRLLQEVGIFLGGMAIKHAYLEQSEKLIDRIDALRMALRGPEREGT